jgi:hypothetical protein
MNCNDLMYFLPLCLFTVVTLAINEVVIHKSRGY